MRKNKKKEPKVYDESVHFYYVRNADGDPTGCVAIEEVGNGRINRGISLCSSKDIWKRNIAREIAYNRLVIARDAEKSKPFKKYNGKESHKPTTEFKNSFDVRVKPNTREKKIIGSSTKSTSTVKKVTTKKTTKTSK